MPPNFSPALCFAPLSLSLQPRSPTLGVRGLLGNAGGRAFLSGCSPSLCYHSSPPTSRLDSCSCRCLFPFATLSTASWGCTENSQSKLFTETSLPPSPLWISAIFFPDGYSQPSPAALRWYVSPLGSRPPLDCKEAHREHARWELRGSQVTVSHPAEPSRHHLALILVGPEPKPSQ